MAGVDTVTHLCGIKKLNGTIFCLGLTLEIWVEKTIGLLLAQLVIEKNIQKCLEMKQM